MRGWPSFSLAPLYGWYPFVVAEMKLNLRNFLLEYDCACVLEQELEEPEKPMGEEVFSSWMTESLWMDQPGHSEDTQLKQRNKWWSFGPGMTGIWQHSKRWSKLKGMSNMTRTENGAVLMIHLAGLPNSSEISSRNRDIFVDKQLVQNDRICSPRQNTNVLLDIPSVAITAVFSLTLRDIVLWRWTAVRSDVMLYSTSVQCLMALSDFPFQKVRSQQLNHIKPFRSSFVMLSRLFTILSSSLGSSQASLEFRWMQKAVHAGQTSLTLEQMVSRRSLGEPLQYILGIFLFLPNCQVLPTIKVLNLLDRLISSLVRQS